MNPSLCCPTCHHPLRNREQGDFLICDQLHRYSVEDGVLVLLDEGFKHELATFLATFEPLRQTEGRRLLEPAVYPQLPCAPQLQSNHEWRLRCYDLALVNRLLAGRKGQRVLDIGAWNGWLSYHLTQQGHLVTAVDYFVDAYDGLRAKKHYPVDWQCIQMDLTDLSVLDDCFDVVIVNRCLPFFADPVAYAQAASSKVAAGGLLILSGLSFFQASLAKVESVAANRRHLQAQGIDYFRPMKGYLDFGDKADLVQAGVVLRPYPQLWRANLKARFKKDAPWYAYGLVYK